MKTATIDNIDMGRPGSGIAILRMSNGDTVFVESGYGIRCLVGIFGSFRGIIGQTVSYVTDGMGLLYEVAPADMETI